MTDDMIPSWYFPAVDNGNKNGIHSGLPGDVHADRDHIIFFPADNGLDIIQSQTTPAFIPKKVGWVEINHSTKNGDFTIETQSKTDWVVPFKVWKENPPSKWWG